MFRLLYIYMQEPLPVQDQLDLINEVIQVAIN